MPTAEILAKERWNHTRIQLAEGARYRFTAHGEWIDWFIRYGPQGGPSGANLFLKLFEGARRMPHESWFALIGAIDEHQSTSFLIGASSVITANRSGELTCYANDVPWAYGNNKGFVTLTAETVQG